MYQDAVRPILGEDGRTGPQGDRDEHSREWDSPMIRYGSVDETAPQPRTERTRPLLPRPRGSAEESSVSRPSGS